MKSASCAVRGDAASTEMRTSPKRDTVRAMFYVAGADPHEGDRLGRLKLSRAGLAERDRRVFSACRERGIPVAVSMAGGYGRDIDITVGVHLRTLQCAFESHQHYQQAKVA